MTEKTFNKFFNIFILAGMTLALVLATGFKLRAAQSGQAMLLVAAFGSIMGILSTVCSANGKILTFLFGLFDVAIYGVMCYMGGKYGNAALHLLYFLPMQFVGFFQWRRRGAMDGGEKKMKARRLGWRARLLCSLGFLALLISCYLLLLHLGAKEGAEVLRIAIFADAFSTVCNILGQLLMSTAYMEQWFFWIGVNVASVVMWSVTLFGDTGLSAGATASNSYALVYLIKYSFYLLNSLNGLRIWLNMSRCEPEAKNQNLHN